MNNFVTGGIITKLTCWVDVSNTLAVVAGWAISALSGIVHACLVVVGSCWARLGRLVVGAVVAWNRDGVVAVTTLGCIVFSKWPMLSRWLQLLPKCLSYSELEAKQHVRKHFCLIFFFLPGKHQSTHLLTCASIHLLKLPSTYPPTLL